MWRVHSFFFPTPRRLKRPNHPNLFLLGLASFHGILRVKPGQRRAGKGQEQEGKAAQRLGLRKRRSLNSARCKLQAPCGGVVSWPDGQAWDIATSTGGERVPVPGTTWGLRSPWLWRGGRAYWVALRHRGRGGGGRPRV